MAYLRLTIWLSLLLYGLGLFRPNHAYGQQIINVPTAAIFPFLQELQLDPNYLLQESPKSYIVKRGTNDTSPPATPQVFKFELDDAKEPDAETKKIIQKKLRELELEDKDIEIISNKTNLSKRSKRSTLKFKPVLIPFLMEDAREPDSATKELIRRSRAKEMPVSKIKETARGSQESQAPDEKREPPRKRRVKAPPVSKEQSSGQGRIKSVPLKNESKEPLMKELKGQFEFVTVLNTETKRPLRKGNVQSVPLTSLDKETIRDSRGKTTPNRQPLNKKPSRKRTKRFAQLSEPRYIKFELHDAKNPEMETKTEVHILPRQAFGSKIQSKTSDSNTEQYDSDSSADGTRYHYIFHEAPPKYPYKLYPKRFEPKDVVFRMSKMQKFIASGQGLENINTNIEISIPPTLPPAAVLGGYPKPVYGQKLCQYGSRGCQAAPLVAMPVVNLEFNKQVEVPQHSVAENEVIPQQQQQYYYVYPQPEAEVNQPFVPIANPYQNVVHAPVAELQPQQQELQNTQNLIDSNKIAETEPPPVKIAYLQPTYGYGSKIYPTYSTTANIIHHTPVNHDQNPGVGPHDAGKNQEANLNLLRDNQEFQELSALIGKSPEDQFHGLSYLLAKEMQRQKAATSQQRPQDQTSPILFHPTEAASASTTPAPQPEQKPIYEDSKVENSHVAAFRPLKPLLNTALATALTQQNDEPKQQVDNKGNTGVSLGNMANKAVGLSPNYNGVDSHSYSPTPKIYSSKNSDDDSAMEYASRYAFGYRVRDFHSGNDFAHKQNRDHDGVTRGQYHILMPDGRIQNVVYYADDTGFHADVSY